MNDIPDNYLGEFRLGLPLTNVRQIIAGGLIILAGLFFVLADPIRELTDTQTPLVTVLVAIILGLTLLSVIELLGGSGGRGGAYILVQETLGGAVAFLTSWSVLAGSLALSAVLVHYSSEALLQAIDLHTPPILIAVLSFSALVLLQLTQLLPRRLQFVTVAGFFIFMLFVVVVGNLPEIRVQNLGPASSVRLGPLGRAVSKMMVVFVAFESLLSSRRQILSPGRQVPHAILGTFLTGFALFLLVDFVVIASASTSTRLNHSTLEILSDSPFLPAWGVNLVISALMLFAANGCMMTAARQIYSLSRDGGLPPALRRVVRPFPMPLGMFLSLIAAGIPLIILGSFELLINFSASIFLITMILLNVIAIYSQQTEPDRRRTFILPFAPLVPAVTIAIQVGLLQFVPLLAWLGVGLWMALGLVVYLGYARTHQAVAREGEIVFGRVRKLDPKPLNYRILVPLGPGEERRLVLSLAVSLANQLEGEIIALQVIPSPDPLAIEEGRRIARERNTLFRWSLRLATATGVPLHPITRLARSAPEGIIDTAVEEDCDLVLMSWPVKPVPRGAKMGSVLDAVARGLPCDLAVVAYHPETIKATLNRNGENQQNGMEKPDDRPDRGLKYRPKRILVPTSGGPHAPLATRLALLLTKAYEATITAVNITSQDATPEEISEGELRIQQTIQRMRDLATEFPDYVDQIQTYEQLPIQGRVIPAEGVVAGIAQAGAESDLVFMGASEESLLDQVLFGNIPEQVAQECPSPVIVVKRYRGLPRLWLMRTWKALFESLPTVELQEQIEIYRSVHRGARPDVDFFVMIGLSAIIATFGLLQSSNAVIIGAMLVAPLFSPLLALSLAIIQGNVRLLRLAIESTLKGLALAIGLATLLAVFSPFKTLTQEIIARTQPNILDLIVALASGAAGAYAIARKDVATALPGVAIAAALMPPISVIGIGLAMGNLQVAGGSSLLFATNLVAIVLAGAVTFFLLGFQPGRRGERGIQLRRGLATTILLFVIITIPLVTFFFQSISRAQTEQTIQNILVSHFEAYPDIELVDLEALDIAEMGTEMRITVPIYASGQISTQTLSGLNQALSDALDRPAYVRLELHEIIEATR